MKLTELYEATPEPKRQSDDEIEPAKFAELRKLFKSLVPELTDQQLTQLPAVIKQEVSVKLPRREFVKKLASWFNTARVAPEALMRLSGSTAMRALVKNALKVAEFKFFYYPDDFAAQYSYGPYEEGDLTIVQPLIKMSVDSYDDALKRLPSKEQEKILEARREYYHEEYRKETSSSTKDPQEYERWLVKNRSLAYFLEDSAGVDLPFTLVNLEGYMCIMESMLEDLRAGFIPRTVP